ncbi:MAG: class I SAM-dependent methyltransferase [Frankiaceae bacterium]
MGLADVFAAVLDPSSPIEVVAFDGSRAGSRDAAVRIEIRNRRAVSYVAHAPGSLGFARAYVRGDIDVEGNLHDALGSLTTMSISELTWAQRAQLLRYAAPALARRPRPPALEVRLRGKRHSKRRDAKAIAHHYDVSNRFYEVFLGPSMAYTCAVYPAAEATLEQAQWTKHELVARKLGLRPGMRLLDVGCGWGGMVMHAAREHGAKALGVTLSRRQAEWAQKAIANAGLQELAEVRHLDYRDVTETGFDAVSSIGLTEHIGEAQLPAYFSQLHDRLKPGGRLLNHCITRPSSHVDSVPEGGFINRYIFPDGELEPVGHLVTQMHDVGFEVRHEENLREHYALTLRDWVANLEANWDEAVAEVGEPRARVWRLYMAGSQVGFESNSIQLHQVLAVKLDGTAAHFPLRPDFEPGEPPVRA